MTNTFKVYTLSWCKYALYMSDVNIVSQKIIFNGFDNDSSLEKVILWRGSEEVCSFENRNRIAFLNAFHFRDLNSHLET